MGGERLRFSIAQAAPAAVGGLYLPFFPLWLTGQGLAASQISLVLGCAMFLRIVVGPTAGIVADALGDRRRVAMACAALAALAFGLMAGLGPAFGLAAILPLVLLAVPLNSATGPIIEAVTARGAIDYSFDYARARLWGSIAFVVTNYLGGLIIGFTGAEAIAWMICGLLVGCAIAFWPLPRLLADRRVARAGMRRAVQRIFSEGRVLLRQPTFLLFLITVTFAQTAHAVFYAFGTITFRSFGYTDSYIGVLWAFGVIAEVALFAFGGRVLRNAPATGLIALGVSLGAIRWIGMAFDTGPVGVLLLQLFHAGSFGLVHLGTMKFLSHAVPARLAATGQSLFSVMAYGLGMGVVTLSIGPLYDAVGARTYLLMAALSLVSLALTFFLARAWNGRSLFAFRNRMGVV
jgi:PPP family 3-phenylpropionic acid transporter